MAVAIELFSGGTEGIRSRMAEVVRDGLKKKVKKIIEIKQDATEKQVIEVIAEKLGVEYSRLIRIYEGKSSNGDVNYDLFDRLEFPLELSIHRVLGKPERLDEPEIEKEWLNECNEHRMLRAAAIVRNIPDDDSDNGKEITLRNELELYVTLRAIKELRANN